MRPREVPIDLCSLPVAVSYSDGEGSNAGIGIALWLPGQRARAGYVALPDAVRHLFGKWHPDEGEHKDIYEVEALGPALVLHNWGADMKDMLWLHFIDNESAQATLIKGSSSVLSGEVITAYTHQLVAKFSVRPWFDRVDSKSAG